jgi:glycosyltransferase involved in cell wall biosynthesis
MDEGLKLRVISPWFPDEVSIYSGVFVRDQIAAVTALGVDVEVEVPTIYPAASGPIPANVLAAMSDLASENADLVFRRLGRTTWVPSPVPARSGSMGRARAFATCMAMKRQATSTSVDVTHAHLGVPTGWAALELGDSPLVVTEHQSTLDDVLLDPVARNAYLDVIERCDVFICVSEVLRSKLVSAFGESVGETIRVIPNIVDLDAIPFRDRSPNALSAWIYVGGLAAHKGVETLLRSFARYRAAHVRDATLTLVGAGPLESWVRRFIGDGDLAGSVRLIGAVERSSLGAVLDAADVMVHLSRYETFGLATLEAIGAGLPVVALANGGVDSTWRDHESACGTILHPSSDPDEVADAVARLRNSNTLDPVIGRSMVVSRFSPDTVGKSLVEVYESCLVN